jgi:type II secretory pathway component GspD/PulD (secretin)
MHRAPLLTSALSPVFTCVALACVFCVAAPLRAQESGLAKSAEPTAQAQSATHTDATQNDSARNDAAQNDASQKDAAQAVVNTLSDPLPCSDVEKSFPACGAPREARKKAREAYRRALRLERQHDYEGALQAAREAHTAVPRDTIYISAEKTLTEKVVSASIKAGDQAMLKSDATTALKDFQRAAELAPENIYALQRLGDSQPRPAPKARAWRAEDGGEVRLQPLAIRKNFEYRGASSSFLQQFGSAFGISILIQEGVIQHSLRIKLDDLDWETGLPIVEQMCKVLFIPLDEHQALVVNDTEENRRAYMRMSLRTFYPPAPASLQELNDLSTALRVLFDLRFVNTNAKAGAIIVRAPQKTMDAIAEFLDGFSEPLPEVMLDVQIYQISQQFNRQIGTTAPTSFTVFNIASELSKLATSAMYGQIVSQLEAAGQTVNEATILLALIASGSSSGVNSPLSSPFATFGGGLTLSGVTIPSVSAEFSDVNSQTRQVDHVQLRAQSGKAANFKFGERYPVVTAQYSAASATSSLLAKLGVSAAALAGVTGGGSTTIPAPQFTYEDIGLVLKATPRLHGDLVTLEYEMTLRSLEETTVNSLPIMNNRDMKGVISTLNGQPIVIAGMVDSEQMKSMTGIPGVSSVPVLGDSLTSKSMSKTYTELMIILTPYLTSSAKTQGTYILLPQASPK